MKKIFFSILLLLLSSCSNNNNNNIVININKTDIEYLISIEDVADPSASIKGASYTRNWLFNCASTNQNGGYFYIADNQGNYGDDMFNKNNNTITLSADTNSPPLRSMQMIYIESKSEIDFASAIKSCISNNFIPRNGVYIRTMMKNIDGNTTYEDIGTRVFSNIKSIQLASGKFDF